MKRFILTIVSLVMISTQSHANTGCGKSLVSSVYWQGKMTASGQRFNPNDHTAAHRTLPFGTQLRVTNPRNNSSVVVTINDRGPFHHGRSLDLSRGAARSIGFSGVGRVCIN